MSTKLAKILNNGINNVKIGFKTNNNLIKHINNRSEIFTKNLFSFENPGIPGLVP
jgi:hypothetical protein